MRMVARPCCTDRYAAAGSAGPAFDPSV
jgi:hypothetical protein